MRLRILPFAFCCAFVAFCQLAILTPVSFAQVIGDLAGPAGDATKTTALEPSPDNAPTGNAAETTDAEPKPDELVRQLESTASRGGAYRAHAIQSLARIGAWPQVDRWVAASADTDDQSKLAETVRLIGPDLLLRISLYSGLSDGSRAAIKTLFAASKAFNQSSDRLRKAIDQLVSNDVDTNLAANRALLAGGHVAIQELVAALVKGLPSGQRSRVIAVLKSMGDGGARSLNQMALYGASSVRPSALDALRVIDPEYALDTLVTAAFAVDSTPDEKHIARTGSSIPTDFDHLDAIASLADRLGTLRRLARSTPNDLSPATLWSLSENRTGIQPARSTQIFLRYRQAYDGAQRLRRLGSLPPSVLRSVLAADLGYRVMVDIDWGDPDQIAQIRSAYPDQLSVAGLLTALDEQRRDEDIPAAVGLIRLLGSSLQPDSGQDSILDSNGGRLSSLVSAVRDPQPRIRYEAAGAIAKLVSSAEAGSSFPGASYYRRTLSEMASLDPRPTAIVLETRPVITLRQEALLGQLGFNVRVVTSALQVEREIAKGGDLRFVLSKIRIADASPAELVDRIRRQPKGSRIPIVFFSDSETTDKNYRNVELETLSNRWINNNTPAVHLIALPGSPVAFSEVLAEVESKRRLPTLSVSDRSVYRSIGTEALQGESLPR